MLGRHAVKTWSTTQAGVSLSSGEAEFYGVLKGSGVGLGFQSLLADLGVVLPLRVWTDSSAAIGICGRQGLGKLRHLETHLLWIQQAVRSRRIDLRKVAGDENPADLFTKHMITREKLSGLVHALGCRYRSGRAESAPQTRAATTGKVTISEAEVNSCAAVAGSEAAANELYALPHLCHSNEELNRLHPTMLAPEALYNDDNTDEWSSWDGITKRGDAIIQEIMSTMTAQGRRRHEDRG
jgi:hypothetical protein